MFTGLIILGFLVYFYFTPFWLCVRYFPDEYRRRVFWWNFWIGWTVVGWLALLLWELVTYPRLVREYNAARTSKKQRIAEARARTAAAFAMPLTHPDGSANLAVTGEQLDALEHEIEVTSEDWL